MKPLLLLALLFVGTAHATGETAFPRNWTVNVGGTWRITGCGNDTMLQVRQEGSRLSLPDGAYYGEVHGHTISFRLPALSCLPQAKAVRFDGEADGARINGVLREDNDALRWPVTIHLQRDFMLSFDDGPLPGKTDRVLDTLRQFPAQDGKPVRAAFFTVGEAPAGFWEGRTIYAPYEIWTHKGSMKAHPELIERMRAEGHAIGNHTAHHAWFRWPRFDDPKTVTGELRAWEAVLPIAQTDKLFRPPYLIATAPVLAAADAAGYQVVLGDTVGDAAPWASVDAIEWRALHIMETRDSSSPALLIFHDIFPVTHEHLGEIIARLCAKGYRLVHFDPQSVETPGRPMVN